MSGRRTRGAGAGEISEGGEPAGTAEAEQREETSSNGGAGVPDFIGNSNEPVGATEGASRPADVTGNDVGNAGATEEELRKLTRRARARRYYARRKAREAGLSEEEVAAAGEQAFNETPAFSTVNAAPSGGASYSRARPTTKDKTGDSAIIVVTLLAFADFIAQTIAGSEAVLNDFERNMLTPPLTRMLMRADPRTNAALEKYLDPLAIVAALVMWGSRVADVYRNKQRNEQIAQRIAAEYQRQNQANVSTKATASQVLSEEERSNGDVDESARGTPSIFTDERMPL